MLAFTLFDKVLGFCVSDAPLTSKLLLLAFILAAALVVAWIVIKLLGVAIGWFVDSLNL